MNLTDELQRLKKHFQVLQGWEIHINNEAKYKGQCVTNKEKKTAVIYGWQDDNVPGDYIFHELMHIALRAIHHPKGFKKQAEEALVQDLSTLYRATLKRNI